VTLRVAISDVDSIICENLESCKLDVEKKISDIELFTQPPPRFGDCPICFLHMPLNPTGSKYYSCCGKVICSGCCYAPVFDNQGNEVKKKCPFCRTPNAKSTEQAIERLKKRVEANDPIAIFNHGNYYRDGRNGFPRVHTKALELWHKAGELGYAAAYTSIGASYYKGHGVGVDKKKAKHYWELAAMRGDETARCNLGIDEAKAGNIDRTLKHFMIALRGGYADSLKQIKQFYTDGHATKDDYSKALRLYQDYLSEIKSVQRDKAAAFSSKYRYY